MKSKIIFTLLIGICSAVHPQLPHLKDKGIIPGPARPSLLPGTVRDIRMNYSFTGPVSAIAVNPLSGQHILLAGEASGLFETRNAGGPGRKWKHLDDFKEHEIMDVLITPAAGGENLWAACSNTFYAANGPLIWRRDIRGNWQQPVFNPSGGFNSALKAYRIMYNVYTQKVYACGEFGIAIGKNGSGAVTNPADNWVFTIKQGPSGLTVFAMEVLKDGTIVAGCNNGIYRLSTTDSEWQRISSVFSCGTAQERFCLKTDMSRTVITGLSMDAANLFKVFSSVDNAMSMQAFNSVADNLVPGAGGLKFILPDYDVAQKKLTIYESNKYEIRYVTTTGNTIQEALTAMQTNAGLSWTSQITTANIGHADTRHIVFLNQGVYPAKMIVTSDGGFHIADIIQNKEPKDFSWTMENTNSGLKSLEITTVTGMADEVFFATWHDAFGASLDQGNTYYNGPAGEGIVISKQGKRNAWDDRTFVTSFLTINNTFGAIRNTRKIFGLADIPPETNWPNPPNDFTSGDRPGQIFISGNTYLQQTNAASGSGFAWQLTTNAGTRWNTIGSTPFRRYGIVTAIGDITSDPGGYSVYVPVLSGVTVQLNKIKKPESASPEISTLPLTGLSNGIAALDLGQTRNAIFGVNPFNDQQLLACESSTGKMKKSSDGGNSWTEVLSFSSYYGSGNQPAFKSSQGYNSLSFISYSSFTNGTVLAGTLSQGIYLSKDGGNTWSHLNNPGVMMVSGIHWISANRAIVSTYGRGLFRVDL